VLPSWPFTIVLGIGIAAIFATLYWFLFVFWIGATPGVRLAWLACSASESGMRGEAEDQPRFR
jgi:hypothetical protein